MTPLMLSHSPVCYQIVTLSIFSCSDTAMRQLATNTDVGIEGKLS